MHAVRAVHFPQSGNHPILLTNFNFHWKTTLDSSVGFLRGGQLGAIRISDECIHRKHAAGLGGSGDAGAAGGVARLVPSLLPKTSTRPSLGSGPQTQIQTPFPLET